jgi:hypothetical protein
MATAAATDVSQFGHLPAFLPELARFFDSA